MNCKTFKAHLPELVLDATAASNTAAFAHMMDCPPCKQEYGTYAATLSVMDGWIAPEPSVYFDQKLGVRLREEAILPKLGFFARLREHMLFNTGRQFRPAVAGAVVLVLMLGGGGYASFENASRTGDPAHVSATVNDLQTLDKNEQTLEQIDQLLEDDSAEDVGVNAPS